MCKLSVNSFCSIKRPDTAAISAFERPYTARAARFASYLYSDIDRSYFAGNPLDARRRLRPPWNIRDRKTAWYRFKVFIPIAMLHNSNTRLGAQLSGVGCPWPWLAYAYMQMFPL